MLCQICGKNPATVHFTEIHDNKMSEIHVCDRCAEEKGLHPLGDPVLEELHHAEGEPFRFKTTFEVLPQFTVKDYRGVEARRPAARIEDREVEDTLESIRQSHAKYVPDPARLAGVVP